MKSRTSKGIALLLCIVLLVALVPVGAFAAIYTGTATTSQQIEVTVGVSAGGTIYKNTPTFHAHVLYDLDEFSLDTTSFEWLSTSFAEPTYNPASEQYIDSTSLPENATASKVNGQSGSRLEPTMTLSEITSNYTTGENNALIFSAAESLFKFRLNVKSGLTVTADSVKLVLSQYDDYDLEDFTYDTAIIGESGSDGGSSIDPAKITVSATANSANAEKIEKGDKFKIDVSVSSTSAYSAVQADVNYPADLVRFVGESSGQNYDNKTGTVTLSGFAYNSGANAIKTLEFEVLAAADITTLTDAVFTIDNVLYAVSGSIADQESDAETSLSVEITPPPVVVYPVTFITDSELAPDGYKVLVYTPDGAIGATDSYTYNGNTLFYAAGLDAFVYIVADSVTDVAASADGVIVAGGTRTVASGDVNGNGKLNIVDAQIVYDLGEVYDEDDLTTLTIVNRLNADVNGDGYVDNDDALAIQWALHHNGEFPVA